MVWFDEKEMGKEFVLHTFWNENSNSLLNDHSVNDEISIQSQK